MKTTYLKSIALFVCLLLAANAYSQKVIEKTVQSSATKLAINFQFADTIHINTWKKSEFYVKVSVNINDNSSNDNFELQISDSVGTLNLKSNITDINKLNRKVVRTDGTIIDGVQMNLMYEVWCPENADIELKTISGNVIFTGNPANVQVNSISGFIDIKASAEIAFIDMETISGVIYSDFEFDKNANENHPVGMKVKDILKTDGYNVRLKTISGDIFYRK